MSTRTRRTVRRSVLWLGLSASAAALAPAPATEPTRLLRTPTVSATQIAFAHADNIWAVELRPRHLGAERRASFLDSARRRRHRSAAAAAAGVGNQERLSSQ